MVLLKGYVEENKKEIKKRNKIEKRGEKLKRKGKKRKKVKKKSKKENIKKRKIKKENDTDCFGDLMSEGFSRFVRFPSLNKKGWPCLGPF